MDIFGSESLAPTKLSKFATCINVCFIQAIDSADAHGVRPRAVNVTRAVTGLRSGIVDLKQGETLSATKQGHPVPLPAAFTFLSRVSKIVF